jgi:BirA family biotin operon repressor/biotin-[acetyl-CoA-carboxylase] ligase
VTKDSFEIILNLSNYPTMNNNTYQIISLLADGKSRSGQEIGDLLNITRSAVWKIMNKLTELGIPVERNQGKGYRFTRPVQMLNKEAIWQALSLNTQQLIPRFTLLDTVDSTNNTMLAKIKEGKPSESLVLTEHQTAGRGRLGRTWYSPYAANIYLALYWHFTKDTSELSGLSQVITTGVLSGIAENNINDLTLKWPNGIYHGQKKLAGVLIDLIAESHSSTKAVIGISVNVSMPDLGTEIDQPWTDIHTITNAFPDRNKIVASILNTIYPALVEFNSHGFTPFAAHWAEHDGLAGKAISAFNAQQEIEGIAEGVGPKGELLIQTADNMIPFSNGSVKLRYPQT